MLEKFGLWSDVLFMYVKDLKIIRYRSLKNSRYQGSGINAPLCRSSVD